MDEKEDQRTKEERKKQQRDFFEDGELKVLFFGSFEDESHFLTLKEGFIILL